MSRLLTEEEIVKEASKDRTYCQLSVDIGKWASKKQDKATLKTIGEAIKDYAHNKISFERLAELLEINLYELDVAFRKRGEIKKEE